MHVTQDLQIWVVLWLLQEENPFSEDQDEKKISAKPVLKSTVVLLVVMKADFMILCGLISDLWIWQHYIYVPSKEWKVNSSKDPFCSLNLCVP